MRWAWNSWWGQEFPYKCLFASPIYKQQNIPIYNPITITNNHIRKLEEKIDNLIEISNERYDIIINNIKKNQSIISENEKDKTNELKHKGFNNNQNNKQYKDKKFIYNKDYFKYYPYYNPIIHNKPKENKENLPEKMI